MNAQVECRNPETGEWKMVHRCLPNYQYVTRGLWPFRWRLITNKEEADQDSLKRATNLARAIYEPDVFFYGKKELKIRLCDTRIVSVNPRRVLWQNGQWID